MDINLGYKIISQLEDSDEIDMKNLIFKLFDLLFNLKNENYLEDELENLSDYDSDDDSGEEYNEISKKPDINIFNFKDNEAVKIYKDKSFSLEDEYYTTNHNDNDFNDLEIHLISGKRKSLDFRNIYFEKINNILNQNKENIKDDSNKFNIKKEKKYP